LQLTPPDVEVAPVAAPAVVEVVRLVVAEPLVPEVAPRPEVELPEPEDTEDAVADPVALVPPLAAAQPWTATAAKKRGRPSRDTSPA
jgi:hypothetical protein